MAQRRLIQFMEGIAQLLIVSTAFREGKSGVT